MVDSHKFQHPGSLPAINQRNDICEMNCTSLRNKKPPEGTISRGFGGARPAFLLMPTYRFRGYTFYQVFHPTLG